MYANNKKMGWCDDINDKKNYNRLININKKNKIKYEKMYEKIIIMIW